MTIRKGQPWGRQVPRPTAVRVVESDAMLAAASTVEGDPILLLGGDLFRSVGGRPSSRAATPGATVLEIPIDLLAVTIGDGPTHRAAGHVVVGRAGGGRLARLATGLVTGQPLTGAGELMFVGNADRIGNAAMFPRGHPNDGRFDVLVVSAEMRWRARRAANRRMLTGTHLPHPHLSTSRASAAEWQFGSPRQVTIDGIPRGRADRVAVSVLADATTVLVPI